MADGIWAMVDGGRTYAINRISHQPFAISHQPSAIQRSAMAIRYRLLTSNSVPAPPPIAAPISAPFLPPKIPPSPAPAAVDPPMTSAVFFQSRPRLPSTDEVRTDRDVVDVYRRGAGCW